jgi:uncharacterized protein (DUF433 family)
VKKNSFDCANVCGQIRAMVTATEHLYIGTDEQILEGEPIITGTRTPVRAIVELWRACLSNLREMSVPSHCNLAEIEPIIQRRKS